MNEQLLREWIRHLLRNNLLVEADLFIPKALGAGLAAHTDLSSADLKARLKLDTMGDFSTEGKVIGKLAEHSVADALTGYTREIETGPWSPIVRKVFQGPDSAWKQERIDDGTAEAVKQLLHGLYLNMKKAVVGSPVMSEESIDLGRPDGNPFVIEGDTGTVDIPTDKADIHVKYNEAASGTRLVGIQLPNITIEDIMFSDAVTGDTLPVSDVQAPGSAAMGTQAKPKDEPTRKDSRADRTDIEYDPKTGEAMASYWSDRNVRVGRSDTEGQTAPGSLATKDITITDGQLASLFYRLSMKKLYGKAPAEVKKHAHSGDPTGKDGVDAETGGNDIGRYINPDNGHFERTIGGVISTDRAMTALKKILQGEKYGGIGDKKYASSVLNKELSTYQSELKAAITELKKTRKKIKNPENLIGSTTLGPDDSPKLKPSKMKDLLEGLHSTDPAHILLPKFARLVEKSEKGMRESKAAWQKWMRDSETQKTFVTLLNTPPDTDADEDGVVPDDMDLMMDLVKKGFGDAASENEDIKARRALVKDMIANDGAKATFQNRVLQDAVNILLGEVEKAVSTVDIEGRRSFVSFKAADDSGKDTVAVARFHWAGVNLDVDLKFEVFNIDSLNALKEEATVRFATTAEVQTAYEVELKTWESVDQFTRGRKPSKPGQNLIGLIEWPQKKGPTLQLFKLDIRLDGDKKTVQLNTGDDYHNILSHNFISQVEYKNEASGNLDLSSFVSKPDIRGPEGEDSFVMLGNTGAVRKLRPGEVGQSDTVSGKWIAKNKAGEAAEFDSEKDALKWAAMEQSEARAYIREMLKLLRS
jgi:hypothetical protein